MRYCIFSHIRTEYRYFVSLCIQSECGKIKTRKTLNSDTIYAVNDKKVRSFHETILKFKRKQIFCLTSSNFFLPNTILDEIYGQKDSKLERRTGKFDMFFRCYWQKLILLIIPNFQKSEILSCSATGKTSLIKVPYTSYHVSLKQMVKILQPSLQDIDLPIFPNVFVRCRSWI